MSGRHKFSELETSITPQRRTRIDRLAEKLGHDMDLTQLRTARRQERPAQVASRDTYCYCIVHNGKVVYYGITIDPRRRLTEHRARWPGATVQVVGPAVTRETALEWRSASIECNPEFGPIRARRPT